MSVLPSRAELLPGTLAMLVLKTLTVGTMHGYAIAQHISGCPRMSCACRKARSTRRFR
jgi:hypothetical protein